MLPPAPSSRAVWAVLAAGGVLPRAAVSAPCAGAVGAFRAVIPSSMRRAGSVITVFSRNVLNCSSVSGMLSGTRLSKSPMRRHRRFVLSLRSCAFCSCTSCLRLFSSCRISSSMLMIFSALVFATGQSLLSCLVWIGWDRIGWEWNGFLQITVFPFYSCLSASIIFKILSRKVSVPLWLKNNSATMVCPFLWVVMIPSGFRGGAGVLFFSVIGSLLSWA